MMSTKEPQAITTGIRYVTPDEAKAMLSNLYERQRPVNKGHMLRIAQDMKEGRFQLSPDPIVVLRDGRLVNGQHRLRAIVESGTTQMMMVTSGWEQDVYDIMDAGLRRALSLRVEQPWLRHKNGIGAVRATMVGGSPYRSAGISEQALVAFALEHEATFVALFDMPGARVVRAGVIAACARAIMAGEERDRIQRFIYLVNAGKGATDGEGAAVVLFQWLTRTRGLTGHVGQAEVYKKSQSALRAFLEDRDVSKLYAAEDDLWPLAGVTDASAPDKARGTP
jgi:hypothetical protein